MHLRKTGELCTDHNHILAFCLHIKLATRLLICPVFLCDKGVVSVYVPRLLEHKQHWPSLNVATIFACVPPIVLLCELCVTRVSPAFMSIPIGTLKRGHRCGICLHFHLPTKLLLCLSVCIFGCAKWRRAICLRCGCVCVGGGVVVWSAGTSKLLWLADWLLGFVG